MATSILHVVKSYPCITKYMTNRMILLKVCGKSDKFQNQISDRSIGFCEFNIGWKKSVKVVK